MAPYFLERAHASDSFDSAAVIDTDVCFSIIVTDRFKFFDLLVGRPNVEPARFGHVLKCLAAALGLIDSAMCQRPENNTANGKFVRKWNFKAANFFLFSFIVDI